MSLSAKFLQKDGVVGGAALLLVGSVVRQGVVLLALPLLTRAFAPTEFGHLAVFVALTAILGSFATLRYELAVLLPRSDASGVALVIVSMVATLVFVAVLISIDALLGEWIYSIAGLTELVPFAVLVPLGVLLFAARNGLNFWALRKRAFARAASAQISFGVGMVAAQLLAASGKFGALGLIAGYIVGLGAAVGVLLLYFKQMAKGHLKSVRRHLLMKRTAYRYRRFPQYSTWAHGVNVLGLELPTILLGVLFSPAAAGFYMLAQRVVNAPVGMVSEAIGKSFMSHVAVSRREGSLEDLVHRVFDTLLSVGVAPFLVVAAVAPEVFSFVFGAEWRVSGNYLQILTPWISAAFIFVPLLSLFSLMERQRALLAFQLALLTVRVAALSYGAWLGEVEIALLAYALASTTMYVTFGVWIMHVAGVDYGRVLVTLGREAMLMAVFGALAIFLSDVLLSGDEVRFGLSAALALAAFLFMVAGLGWRGWRSVLRLNEIGR